MSSVSKSGVLISQQEQKKWTYPQCINVVQIQAGKCLISLLFSKKIVSKNETKNKWNLFLLFDLKLILRIFSVTYVAYWLAVVYLNAGKWSFDRKSMIHQITLYHRTAKGIPFIPYDIISIKAHICLHSVRYSHTMRARENALSNERFVCAFPLLCCYSYSVCA